MLRDWALLIVLTALAFAFPIRMAATKEAAIALMLMSWCFGMFIFRRSILAWGISVFILAFVLWAALTPAKPYDREALRSEYVRCLGGYMGVKYVWGGENSLGIDCSGLVREGMIVASLRRGLATANPGLVRDGIFVWWHDCSAAMLGDGYGGRTQRICDTDSLNTLNYARLRPGDIAVTEGGVHTLAYLGRQTWIEADPNALTGDKVIEVTVPRSRNAWLNVGMRILRWRSLN